MAKKDEMKKGTDAIFDSVTRKTTHQEATGNTLTKGVGLKESEWQEIADFAAQFEWSTHAGAAYAVRYFLKQYREGNIPIESKPAPPPAHRAKEDKMKREGNNMKKILSIFIFMAFLVSSCGTNNVAPTVDVGAIQTSAVSTALAKQPTNAPVATPLPTETLLPTKTPLPSKETFIFTNGLCLGHEPRYIPTGDPTIFEYCRIDEKRQVQLSSGESVQYASFDPFTYPSFCALHKLDGTYVTSFVDTLGAGEAVCTPP